MEGSEEGGQRIQRWFSGVRLASILLLFAFCIYLLPHFSQLFSTLSRVCYCSLCLGSNWFHVRKAHCDAQYVITTLKCVNPEVMSLL